MASSKLFANHAERGGHAARRGACHVSRGVCVCVSVARCRAGRPQSAQHLRSLRHTSAALTTHLRAMKIDTKRGTFDVTVPPKGTQTVIDEPVDFETAIAQTGFGRFNYMLMAAGFFSTIVCLIDTTTMSYILPLAQCDLGLTDLSKGALNAITYAGLISGSFVWGFLSDTLGRHRLLVISVLLDGTIALCSAFSTSLWLMLLLRYLNGCMSCGALCINFSFLAEFHGAQYRNRCVMTTGIYVGIAQVALPAIGLGLLTETWEYETSVLTLRPWNVFVMMCSVPSLASGLLISFFPETPKFLMAHGRNEEALAVMRKIYALNTGNSPDTFPVRRLVDEIAQRKTSLSSAASSPKSVLESARAGWRQIRPLFSMPHLPYALLVFSVQACCLLSLNTVRLWLPQIFTTMEEFYEAQRLLGLEGEDAYMCEALTFRERNATLAAAVASAAFDTASGNGTAVASAGTAACVPALTSPNIYTNSMIVCASATFAIFISTTLVNIIGYRLLIIISALVSAAFSVLVLWSVGSAATLALLTLYLATVNVYGACMIGVVVAIFPTTLRTMAMSLTMMCGFIAALFGNLIYPVLMAVGCETPFYVVTACNLGAGLLSILLPSTKGRALA
ncbi:synaptic vesicle glycoprotein 2A-like [Schistocerca serialis cubense]|uniref:synaptic vesicle glycoprotein 2A-like n=1 Tax=Schistocerca serialis cubense TaxID=2023355 RepID=UPI00214DF686|nr:synaptic vesicle glycoprotein 2A-like [Schistocerca serialis cubense]